MIRFLEPGWLLLLVPLLFLAMKFRVGTFIRVLHVITATVIILAMSQPSIKLESKEGKLVVICDRSDSMPPRSDDNHKEIIEYLEESRPARSAIEVVSFGRRVAIERGAVGDKFEGFTAAIDPSGSRLGEAISTGLSLVDRDGSARILVISDGESDEAPIRSATAEAAARGISVDFRHLGRRTAGDVAIERFEVPQTVAPAESHLLTAWVTCDRSHDVAFRLTRGSTLIAEGIQNLHAGRNRMIFRDIASKEAGAVEYRLTISATTQGDENGNQNSDNATVVRNGNNDLDEIPENNTARAIVSVDGPKPILHIAESDSALPDMLRAGGLKVQTVQGDQIAVNDFALENLGRYSAVLLENVGAERLTPSGMETVRGWVSHAGGGLLMTGGRNSYAIGGYYQSPLEEIMPLSMELRKEHRKFAVAIAVVLDRSGSMTAPAEGAAGKSKMDLANIATMQVYDLLSPLDEFACIAVDSTPHTVVPMSRVNKSGPARGRIRKIESMGGGIFVYEGLKAATSELMKATAGVRHIILFADAADSEEPGDYKKLLKSCADAGVTCSVIGLGSKADCDAQLLRDIAKAGNGRCFFSNRADDLPRLFAQDTFVVARNSFIEETTPISATAGMSMLTDQSFGPLPSLDGHNLCYLRPDATMAIVAKDEDNSPILAAWHSGLGRVLCFTGEVDGKYSGAFGQWDHVGPVYTTLGRWTAGFDQILPQTMYADQSIVGETNRVRLYLDPSRQSEAFEGMPLVHVLQSRSDGSPSRYTYPMHWETPDMLEANIPLTSGEVMLATVEVPGCGKPSLGPICLPYGPEYRPRPVGEGLRILNHLAERTGGKERTEISGIWGDLPLRDRYFALMPWLALLAAILLLIEVLQRRTGLLTVPAAILKLRRDKSDRNEKSSVLEKRKQTIKTAGQPVSGAAPVPEAQIVTAEPVQPTETESDGAGLLDAIQKASSKAKNRTGR